MVVKYSSRSQDILHDLKGASEVILWSLLLSRDLQMHTEDIL